MSKSAGNESQTVLEFVVNSYFGLIEKIGKSIKTVKFFEPFFERIEKNLNLLTHSSDVFTRMKL